MLCPACQTEFPSGASFCPKCGHRVDGSAPPIAPPSPPPQAPAIQPFAGGRGQAASEPERDLWSGGYSPKAMIGWWILEGILVAAGVVASIALPNPITWIVAAAVIVAFGLWLLIDLLIKRLSVHYKLTTEQLSHQTGLLTRVSNRVELIDVDDVTLKQTIIERMLGVGSILIASSDKSHPQLLLQGIDNVEQVTQLIDTAARDHRRKRAAYIEAV